MNLVFIIGTGRCGSSLIHEIIAGHEDVGFISNIEDNLAPLNLKGRWNNALFRLSLGRLTRKGAPRFSPSEAYQLISRQVSPIYTNSTRDLEARDVTPWLEQRFCAFFEQRYRKQRKAVFIHKYTGWSRLEFFTKIFPEARFIHIIRDGRAVANSWLQMPWWEGYRGPENWPWGSLKGPYLAEWLESNQSYTRLAGIGWKLLLNSYEKASQRLPRGRYLELHYEDFLNDPRSALESMLSFIGLGWSAHFERHFSRQAIRSERNQAYEQDLFPDQLAELEASLAETLIRYNYMDPLVRYNYMDGGR